jgi:hypothetical protein
MENAWSDGILFAHNGGTITASGGLTLDITGTSNTGLTAAGANPTTGTPSKITANLVTLTGTPGASTGAVVDNGGAISITDSTLNVSKLGFGVGTGSINATNVTILLGELPAPNLPQIGAQVLNAGGTITLTGGCITDARTGGGGDQSIGLRAENGATLIANGTNISGGFNKSAEATTGRPY